MCRRCVLFIVFLLTLTGGSLPLAAQDDTGACPALVTAALVAAGDVCGDLGRNEACYGHNLVTATTWEEAALLDFEMAGDLADLFDLASLATFPLSLEDETWGVALLSLQADLPETLPGQNVAFVVYGEAELRSDVSPEVLNAPTPTPLPTCTGRTSGGTNLRTGPSTAHAIAGSVGAGEAFIVSGRDATGEWLRVTYRAQDAWVYAPLLTLDCDPAALPQVSTGTVSRSVYTTPMQAFYLTTGLSEPACAEAPRDGLLIQAPQGTTVHFMINGIEVAVGSTALLQMQGSTALGVNTFAGTVAVTSAGSTQSAAPGQRVDAAAGAAPAPPVPYDPADVANAPVELLPEPVEIPPPAAAAAPSGASRIDMDTCYHNPGTVFTVPASHRIRAFIAPGCWLTAEASTAMMSVVTVSLTVDGVAMTEVSRGAVSRACPGGTYNFMVGFQVPPLSPGDHVFVGYNDHPPGQTYWTPGGEFPSLPPRTWTCVVHVE